ncbi:cysteine-rich RLK (RECEPTOR-like protein kinase) 8 [Hibiscus trionum]|uniref:Cysteine-rich RLK (RECEPTOR-like protein kinase) 8 n=1 Tax=Hibiscus trionum TaxID=183268 RepID=A0A9W7MMQ2_HIBTR|nr:cysteine-rich RLK (RECEPTOR-like protein kinase) 8 [Hibiscus trionum]
MVQPPGFEKQASDRSKLVCRLKKSLYRLKQAPSTWFEKLQAYLVDNLKFKELLADALLYFWGSDGHKIYIMVYVDDVVITGENATEVNSIIKEINTSFLSKI